MTASTDTAFALEVEKAIGGMQAQARDRLVARAAHDLRSPLNGIQGWAHVLSSRLGQEGGIVAKALDGIRSGVQQQVQMIGDLTDLLHVMTGELNLEFAPSDAQALLEHGMADAQSSAQARSVQLKLGEPLVGHSIFADAARLTQALRYVIIHCVRCAIEGDVIVLRTEKAGQSTLFHVGSPDLGGVEVAERVITKTPAALLLAERLVQLHGGWLAAFALDAEGIRQGYRIELPTQVATVLAADPVAYRRLASVRAQMPREPLHVLVKGDGDEPVALTDLLRGLGCVVTLASGGAAPATPCDIEFVPVHGVHSSPLTLGCARLAYGSAGAQPAGGILAVVDPRSDPLQVAGVLLAAHAQAKRDSTATETS